MKKIMENYRSFLAEGMKTFEDFVDANIDMYVEEKEAGAKFFAIERISQNVVGTVEIDKIDTVYRNPGNCLGAWQVSWSEADKGYGPLIYDVAMEYASREGRGLTCDRLMVSDKAYRVWKYYLENRSDVEIFQLDDLQNSLTPDDKDNCSQDSVANQYDRKRSKESKFPVSPLAKMYRKNNMNTIKAFKERGRWKMEVSYDALDHVEYNDMNDVIDYQDY